MYFEYLNYFILILLFIKYINPSSKLILYIFISLILIYLIYLNDNKYINFKILSKKLMYKTDLKNFYKKNFFLTKFDKINYIKSIKYLNLILKILSLIKNSNYKYYYYDLIENYKYLTIKYFSNIQYSIPLTSEFKIYLKKNLEELNYLIDNNIYNLKDYLIKSPIKNIYYKNIHDIDKIIPYNKFYNLD
tara:strand:+ start:1897 stop:2466 length:570 start_codon:yes stop_codon:yes gene_type:complete